MQAKTVDPAPKSVLTEFLCTLTSLCARHAWLTILLVTASAIGCAYYSYQNLKFKTDRADLIDPSAKFYKRWLHYTESFGESDDIVIVVEAKQPETIKQALDEIGSRLKAHPDLFASVLYKVEPGALREKGLQYLPPEVLANGLERLDDFRPILNGNWDLITLNGVVTRLHSQLSRLKGQSEAESQLLHHADLLMTSLVKTFRERDDFTNPWPEILSVPDEMEDQGNQTDYLLNEAGTMGFVMATAVQNKGTFEGPTAAIDMIRRAPERSGAEVSRREILTDRHLGSRERRNAALDGRFDDRLDHVFCRRCRSAFLRLSRILASDAGPVHARDRDGLVVWIHDVYDWPPEYPVAVLSGSRRC